MGLSVLIWLLLLFLEIAVFAPLASYIFSDICDFALTASHFSFSSKRKVTKRMPSRFVCPEKSIRGAWILNRCLRARLDALSVRARLNSPSLANLLYQRLKIQQTKGELKTLPGSINRKSVQQCIVEISIVFDFDTRPALVYVYISCFFFWLTLTSAKPLRDGG